MRREATNFSSLLIFGVPGGKNRCMIFSLFYEVFELPVSKALIVEDNPSIAASLSQLLQHHNWLSEVAGNGEDGLQLLEQFAFDLLLLDWGLPGMSGLEVCKHVRARGDTLPILFVTAQGDIDSTEAGLEAGGD